MLNRFKVKVASLRHRLAIFRSLPKSVMTMASFSYKMKFKAVWAELNDNKRRKIYVEMQLLCRDDGGTIIPLFRDYVEAVSQKVQHGPMSGNLEADGCRNAERWRFES